MLIINDAEKPEFEEFLSILRKHGYKTESNIDMTLRDYELLKSTINVHQSYKSVSWESRDRNEPKLHFPRDKDEIFKNLKINMKSNQYSYTITDKSVTLFENARPFIAKSDHPNFKKIRELIKKSNFSEAVKLFDIVQNIKNLNPNIEIKNNSVYYDGKIQHNYVANRILAFLKEGFDIKPLVKFLENLYQNPLVKDNPNHYLVEDLYKFLEQNNLPLTPDGAFLAWKKTDPTGMDLHSRTIKYETGKVIEEPWEKVSKDRGVCSGFGLYFGAKAYFDKSGFGNGDKNLTFLVKVFPQDVASVPVSYEHSKGRACKLTVYSEYNEKDNYSLNKPVINKLPKRDSSGRFCK